MSFKGKKKASKHWLITVPGNDKSTILLYIFPQCLPAEIFTREALAGLWMNDIGGLMRSKVPQMLFSGGKKSTMLQKIIEKNQKFRKNGLGMCTLITEVVVGRAQTCSCWRGESTWASTAPNRCVCIFISDKKKKNKKPQSYKHQAFWWCKCCALWSIATLLDSRPWVFAVLGLNFLT